MIGGAAVNVSFRQLRTCRRRGSGLLCATYGSRGRTRLVLIWNRYYARALAVLTYALLSSLWVSAMSALPAATWTGYQFRLFNAHPS
jgi:hypothetical protein